ncbi:4'-phosphopantetheinyl transferase family protein [Flavobacterium turcicum]|uniref:4'-phosphopantetheinyl transferase superfamily protein n=1 Tax=Flavobacterium turcicum TaxID=2764718 RepID=A0ABR7JCY4_9FLAO|nr:4'-phosphopantetheinyl transferase superfamily protein [Flavobacterium turcicum]MBC5862294.1 4'-phosphopantetheinyl transferase superfamily protein [Flavobacterium turcicum]NHL01025.1 4'-phosphopantetheinyl transferase superfamily protein [Flavobacterium turcicum]
MPLFQDTRPQLGTRMLIWKVTESLTDLQSQIQLRPESQARLESMKSELHQRAFLSVRMLLQEADFTDFDLYYDIFGKPHLQDGQHISITHSHEFAAIIISDQKVGIDIELQREKIKSIASKFCDAELTFLVEQSQDYIPKLTVIWGAKEVIFKIRNEKGISFKNHIRIQQFDLNDQYANAQLLFDAVPQNYDLYFQEIENFSLVYAFEQNRIQNI